MRRPTSRQNSNVASFSVSISGRQPNRVFQRIGSNTNDESTYRKSSFAISKRSWIPFIWRIARLPASLA